VVLPGRRLKLVCDMSEFAGWKKVEFYSGARKLGTVRSGTKPSLTVTARKDETVCTFTALATGRGGVVRASGPFYVFVRDPRLPLESRPEVSAKALTSPAVARAAAPTGQSPASAGPVLVAPGLTAAQERLFGSGKGTVSAFWEQISPALHLTQAQNADEGTKFSIVTTADARMTLKAAHTARGLYFYVEVTDNCFMECDPGRYYSTDAVDILLDSKPSAVITDAANERQLICQGWGLSLTTKQIHVAFGNRTLPPFFLRNYADPWDFTQHRATFAEARKRFGIEIRFAKLSKLVRVQEWFLPWAEVGADGLPGEPAIGTKLAFAAGYNDMDPGQTSEKKLRLIGGTSPWKCGAGTPAPRGWGDLEIGPVAGEQIG